MLIATTGCATRGLLLACLLRQKAEMCAQSDGQLQMHAGAVIAAATDLSFSLSGYSAVIGNDFLTALYLILVKNTPATAGLTTTGLLFYNAALSLPILGVALAASREPAGIIAYPDSDSWGFRVCCSLWIFIFSLYGLSASIIKVL